jgi:predicted transport protein
MDWLVTHQDSFYLLVMKKLGKEIADKIDWSLPRLYCVANNFTKYDENAIKQMSRNISLFRYKKYNSDLILLELLGSNINIKKPVLSTDTKNCGKSNDLSFTEKYDKANIKIRDLYEDIRLFILSLGDDVTENQLKLYVAFKKTKNIICLEIHSSEIVCYLRLNPKTYALEEGFTKDMSSIGHWGTGDLEVRIKNSKDFEKAKHLFEDAYNKN